MVGVRRAWSSTALTGMGPFGVAEPVVRFAVERIQGFIKPSDAERAAAFDLLVELSTRTTVTPLAPNEGLLREALSSMYSMFDLTRKTLRDHGVEVAKDRRDGNMPLAVLAVRVLNGILRPVLSRWHPRLEDHEAARPPNVGRGEWERRWTYQAECRADLNRARADIRTYLDVLGRIAGAPSLAGAVLPLPSSTPLHPVALDAPPEVPEGARPRRHMVRWFDLAQLVAIAVAWVRSRKHTDAPVPFELCDVGPGEIDGELWIDYVADLGDAFDPTMAVAWQVARPSIRLPPSAAGEHPTPPAELPRGSLLVFGGDLVYPNAGADRYVQQLELPYRMAWPPGDNGTPNVLAVPGNHDWIGGIEHFEEAFVKAAAFAGHWAIPQKGRWFAVRLPRGWWLWGLDTKLDDRLPDAEKQYFEFAAGHLSAGDRVILCSPVPLWQLRQRQESRYAELRAFIDGAVRARGATIPLFLSGDSHFFAHYRAVDLSEDHVTAGGGGAFLHPTHNLAEQLPYERGTTEFTLTARWPLPADSRALAPGLSHIFDRQFRTLAPVVALLHVAYAALVSWRPLSFDRASTPMPGWQDAASSVIAVWAGWPILVAMVLLAVVASRPNSDESMLARGVKKYGLLHGAMQALLVFAAAALARWALPRTAFWWHFVAMPLVAAVVSLAVFVVMTSWINSRIKANDNLAFSKAHLTRYKNFLRMRIDTSGDLTVFAVGLDPVGEGWYKALTQAQPPVVPPFDPAGTPRLHYIWGTKIKGTPMPPSRAP